MTIDRPNPVSAGIEGRRVIEVKQAPIAQGITATPSRFPIPLQVPSTVYEMR